MQQAVKTGEKTIDTLYLSKQLDVAHSNIKYYVSAMGERGEVEIHCPHSVRTQSGKVAVVYDLAVGGKAHRSVVSRYRPELVKKIFGDKVPDSERIAELAATITKLEAKVTALQQQVKAPPSDDSTDMTAFGQIIRRLTEHDQRMKNLEKSFITQHDEKLVMVRKFLDLLD